MRRKKKDKPPNTDHFSVKCALGTILLQPFRLALIGVISQMSIAATNIAVLAGLLFLYRANEAVDNGNQAFFQSDGEETIHDCFKAVLRHNAHSYLMPARFREWVHDCIGLNRWPKNTGFGNCFKYLHEQYSTNVMTNLRYHCESRLKRFFKMCVYELNDRILRANIPNATLFDHIDIRNAVRYAYNRVDKTAGNIDRQQHLGVLLDELRAIGAPFDCNIRDYVTDNWFHSLKMWMEMQRAIENFHLAYANIYNSWNLFRKCPLYVQRPTYDGITIIPEPPIIRNFTAVPTCSFQRRHVRIDTDTLYNLLCAANEVPKKIGKVKSKINIKDYEFRRNPAGSWALFVDMDRIRKMVRGKKEFAKQIVSDGVSVTVLYLKPVRAEPEKSNEEIICEYEAGKFWYELGIDPGMRTWNATVRRNAFTGEEVNLKMSSKQYHYRTKQGVRNEKQEQMTRLFTFEEQTDRNEIRKTMGLPNIPSPRGITWSWYIIHRLRMFENGIQTYTTRNYARLRLDKHIEWHRAIDILAGKLVNHKPAIIYFGCGSIAPNSPIRIKKYVRCPGNRKLMEAFKKRGNCIVRMVDEFMTSQTCALCFGHFHRRTKGYRYKLCANCVPNPCTFWPELIVTNVSKRLLQMRRAIMKLWRELRDAGNEVAALVAPTNTRRLVSKKQSFLKTWHPIANLNVEVEDAEQRPKKTVWHRDICAAKLILYRGHCELYGYPVHPALLRQAQNENNP